MQEKDIRIVVLPSGWVVVGMWQQVGHVCELSSAYVVRIWGTRAGLGEIALNGPTDTTILDKAGVVKYNESTYLLDIQCNAKKWVKYI